MSVVIVGDTVLEERYDGGVAGSKKLLASARAEALATLRELHRCEGMSASAADMRERPAYWLGRLEGVVLSLIVAADLAVAGEAADE